MSPGVLPPSNGEALVHGQPITSSGGMDQIRSMMGVCPQFDVLWGELTGAEHLNIYGHVKGVYWRLVNSQCEELLERVSVGKCGGSAGCVEVRPCEGRVLEACQQPVQGAAGEGECGEVCGERVGFWGLRARKGCVLQARQQPVRGPAGQFGCGEVWGSLSWWCVQGAYCRHVNGQCEDLLHRLGVGKCVEMWGPWERIAGR